MRNMFVLGKNNMMKHKKTTQLKCACDNPSRV